LVDKFANGEARGAGSCDGVRGDLLELTLALVGGTVVFLVADEGARTLVSFEQAIVLELTVGAHDSVGIDFEIDGELADGGQLVAGSEVAGCDGSADLVNNLAVDGHSAVHVEMEAELGFGPGTHVYQTTSTPDQFRRQVDCAARERRCCGKSL